MKITKSILSFALIGLLAACLQQNSQEAKIAKNTKVITWQFPLPRTHTGILLGNGVQGLMVWGKDNQLNITVGRAGFWDRRGGNNFSTRTNYQQVKQLLQNRDEAGLKTAFAIDQDKGNSGRPHQVGGGKVVLTLPEGWLLKEGKLHLTEGKIEIFAENNSGERKAFSIMQSPNNELAMVDLPTSLVGKIDLKLVPSWDLIKETLTNIGVEAPERFELDAGKGFQQNLPEDSPLSMGYFLNENQLTIATAVQENAKEKVHQILKEANITEEKTAALSWWENYWKDIPRLNLPDKVLQELYDYGIYKQGCCTPPQGLACTLQGPFLEAYQLPPWSADYHFNVNIQMIYWPVLASGKTAHLQPLWDMLMGWYPNMKQTGEVFFGREGAIMMPHAVDDRCQVVGSFWTGTIDHACASWMSQLAWLHYRYTLDKKVLKEVAWPLMMGAFEGYWAMAERKTDVNGKTILSLPVSVSPEFKGSRMDAWGENASFQLGAFHMVAENLISAAKILDEIQDPRWEEALNLLPPYTTVFTAQGKENPENKVEKIALWEDMDLIGSHRHHSHLASIYPFITIDPFEEPHQEIVNNSLWHLTYTGAGAWSGWCVPWASTLFARVNNADGAVGWLHHFNNYYTNEGRGTLHNGTFRGMSVIADAPWDKQAESKPNREVMQLDGGFGAVTAITELLVQHRREGIYILPDIPRNWQEFDFEGIYTEGAFRVSAKVINRKVSTITIESLKGGNIKLNHGLGKQWKLGEEAMSGEFLERDFAVGEKIVLSSM
ncbi:MAG: glycoside hydrolase family 95-like protein [Bacteroidota bacterium]